MSIPNDVSRRTFLMTSAAAVAAVGASSARAKSANDTLNIGCIGTGGRCQTLMKSLVKVPNVRIAAVCDIYDAHLAAGRKLADPKAVATKSTRKFSTTRTSTPSSSLRPTIGMCR